ncbi:unnamed protein product [Symbiodinium microadriaticum]|nr:unnamed protein product [Symbiodinium microadriaticum]
MAEVFEQFKFGKCREISTVVYNRCQHKEMRLEAEKMEEEFWRDLEKFEASLDRVKGAALSKVAAVADVAKGAVEDAAKQAMQESKKLAKRAQDWWNKLRGKKGEELQEQRDIQVLELAKNEKPRLRDHFLEMLKLRFRMDGWEDLLGIEEEVIVGMRQHWPFLEEESDLVDYPKPQPASRYALEHIAVERWLEDVQVRAASALNAAAPTGVQSAASSQLGFDLRYVVARGAPSSPRACLPLVAMETRQLQVWASTMSGKTVKLSMDSDDSLLYLRHQVSQSLGLSTWQLRLLLDGEIMDKRGRLEEIAPAEGHELQVLTVTVPLPSEVASRSSRLWTLLRNRITRDVLSRSSLAQQAVKERILLGEVDFFYNGDNLLELAARSLPRIDAKETGCLLLDGGADVNGKSSDGYTPLQTACCRGLVGLSELLLQRGANRFTASPSGEDALDCALGFLAACNRFGSQEREEDVDLAKLCCRLRNSRIERARSSGELVSSLVKARLCLSRVATQLALLGGKFVKLSQKEVFERSGLSEASVQSFQKHLWAGWPGAFLTFDTCISEEPKIQESFAHARSRVLAYRLSQNKTTTWTYKSPRGNRRFCWVWESDYLCFDWDYEDIERGECWLTIGDYSQRKMQNRKWETAKANTRSCRRVAFEPSRRRDSHSTRLARRMPRRDVQMARRKERLRGVRENLSKFQLVRDQLWQ